MYINLMLKHGVNEFTLESRRIFDLRKLFLPINNLQLTIDNYLGSFFSFSGLREKLSSKFAGSINIGLSFITGLRFCR